MTAAAATFLPVGIAHGHFAPPPYTQAWLPSPPVSSPVSMASDRNDHQHQRAALGEVAAIGHMPSLAIPQPT